MKFAIIGNGFIFPRHKKAIEDLGHEVYLICGSPGARFDRNESVDFEDWVLMYNSKEFQEVDAVSICTPNYLHSAMAREALVRGKKVLIEKPMCIDTSKGLMDAKVVLQLRYHPALQNIKATRISVEAKMYRDKKYWDSWKGDHMKSGGILYNLGVHYLDLMIFLLGDVVDISDCRIQKSLVTGIVQFKKGTGNFRIEIVEKREYQNRSIIVNGRNINLSNKDNLSYEDLHKKVYEEFIAGRGIPAIEAVKSLNLIEDLYAYNSKSLR